MPRRLLSFIHTSCFFPLVPLFLFFCFSFFCSSLPSFLFSFFFLNYTSTTEIYTLSLHDALPIFNISQIIWLETFLFQFFFEMSLDMPGKRLSAESFRVNRDKILITGKRFHNPLHIILMIRDRKSTRLNSSHVRISYAVFCLKKKK